MNDLNLNKISGRSGSIIEMLIKISSMSEKTLFDKREIGNIASTIVVNAFALELFHEIIESIIKIKAIDSNSEKILVDNLGARGVYGSLTQSLSLIGNEIVINIVGNIRIIDNLP